MKILHLCLACFYIDNYSYQENLLPKYHKQMGHEVKIIASLMSFDSSGKRCYLPTAGEYMNEDGIPVKRLNYKEPEKVGKLFRTYRGTYDSIKEFAPDIIFIHGVQFSDISQVVKYVKRNPNTKVYVDNHSDFSNSANNWVSKNIQHKIIWKHYAQMINPYTERFYGVLPARVDFLVDMYHLPKEKVKLLVMGADDELAEKAANSAVRNKIREKYGFDQDDFLIVNGGKIDQWKKQTLLLMDAVNQTEDPKIKLLVFGSVTPELREQVEKRCSDKVKYIGWVQSNDSYELFAAGDIACFPGRHSVFWEQVAGQGIPMICKYWEGTTHVDCGNNAVFLYDDSVEEIKRTVLEIFKTKHKSMLASAQECKHEFLYSVIAKKAIELNF